MPFELSDRERRLWAEALAEHERTGFLPHVNHQCGPVPDVLPAVHSAE